MSYFCQQCGECCSVMGQVFQIVEDLGEFRYLLRNEYTGDTIPVEVTPTLRGLYLSGATPPGSQNPCPFVRWDAGRMLACCTVHLSRPDICREYQCWRILVEDAQGRRVARVMDERFLCLENEGLRESWELFRDSLDSSGTEEWDEKVIRFFKEHGFSVRV